MKINTHRAIFMVGGPGSGKSYVAAMRYPDMRILDCDKWKETHPDYDPANPSVLHNWSRTKLAEEFSAVIATGENFVYDGTGVNAERHVHNIRMAHSLGYHITLCYVKSSMKTALRRNAERARTVDENLLREKHSLIATAFEIIAEHVDAVEIVNND